MNASAAFAAAEFIRRQALAQNARDAGTMAREEAEARLWPWLAIAAAAGAQLPELVDADNGRRIFAHEFAEPEEYKEILAKARDAVIEANRCDEYGRGIVALADALRCRPWHPRPNLSVAA